MPHYISSNGLKKLKEELDDLKNNKRKEVIERISRAKDLGDLSENAEYSAAKDDQSFMEGRIIELEKLLIEAIIVDEKNKTTDIVDIGNKVSVRCGDETKSYTIVGSKEANPQENMISNESPLGQAFLGKKVGDVVKVTVPKGEIEYQVVTIE